MKIAIEKYIGAPIDIIWRAFCEPNDILQWDASEDWYATQASNNLRVGGLLKLRIDAKDGGTGFDFAATYTRIEPKRLIEWRTDNNLYTCVEFIETGSGITVRQTFDAELTPSVDEQRLDWQGVLDNFAQYVTAVQKQILQNSRNFRKSIRL